jgi:hypothetical protein
VIVRNPYTRAVAAFQCYYYYHYYQCHQTGMKCINNNERISTTAHYSRGYESRNTAMVEETTALSWSKL